MYQVTASSFEDVLNGIYEKKDIRYTGKWLVDTDATKLELRCSQELRDKTQTLTERYKTQFPKRNTSNSPLISVPCLDHLFIRNNKNGYELSYSEFLVSATLSPKEYNLSSNIRDTPLDMGIMGGNEEATPYQCINDSLRGDFPCQYSGTRTIYGMTCEVVSLFPKNGEDKYEYVFGFAQNKGYLPVYIYIKFPGDVVSEAVITDTKEFSGDRWFPMRSVKRLMQSGKTIRTIVYEVNAISIDQHFSKQNFEIILPPNSQVTIAGVDSQWQNVEHEMTVTPDMFIDLHNSCIKFAKEYNAKMTIPPSQIPNQKLNAKFILFRCFLIGVGLCLVLYGIFLKIKQHQSFH
jgi:hypothetical protein